ncbi:MAG: hypothetical protein ACK5RG_16995 [Cyclobacteriaceae bacterium]|jgi:hypothetical protein
MRINLNIQKSIESGWVINSRQDFDTQFNQYLSIFVSVALLVILLVFPIFLWMGIYTGQLKSSSTIVFPGILFKIGLIGLYGFILGNKFVRFRGSHDLTKNQEAILRLLKEYYPKNNFYQGDQFMTSYLKPTGFMRRSKPTNRILVLFDTNDILLNISVFSDGGIQSPFHTLFHHWTIYRIKSRLKESLNVRN